MYDPNFPPPAKPEQSFLPPPPPPRNTLALVALVCGILSVITMIFNWVPNTYISYIACVAPIFSLAAIITGIIGLRFSRNNKNSGSGQAITGIVLGSLILVLFLFIFVVAFMIGFTQGLGM